MLIHNINHLYSVLSFQIVTSSLNLQKYCFKLTHSHLLNGDLKYLSILLTVPLELRILELIQYTFLWWNISNLVKLNKAIQICSNKIHHRQGIIIIRMRVVKISTNILATGYISSLFNNSNTRDNASIVWVKKIARKAK